jgi:hypothetical protein
VALPFSSFDFVVHYIFARFKPCFCGKPLGQLLSGFLIMEYEESLMGLGEGNKGKMSHMIINIRMVLMWQVRCW